jgi:hypothetical protein
MVEGVLISCVRPNAVTNIPRKGTQGGSVLASNWRYPAKSFPESSVLSISPSMATVVAFKFSQLRLRHVESVGY